MSEWKHHPRRVRIELNAMGVGKIWIDDVDVSNVVKAAVVETAAHTPTRVTLTLIPAVVTLDLAAPEVELEAETITHLRKRGDR